jgi:nucleoside-diphosphate-sugar epimerase
MDYLGYGLMHFLVTGAQGFLGDRVVNTLRNRGATVTSTGRTPSNGVVYCDLTVAEDVAQMIESVSPDRIVHCAANVPSSFGEYEDVSGAQINLRMVNNILSATSCPMVYISSMTVYGKEINRPVAEEDAGNPTSAYGNSKWQSEELLLKDGRASFAVRIPGLFGPSRNDGLVYKLIRAIKYDDEIPVIPDFPVLWAAMHVDDAAESVASLAMSKMEGFEAINVGYSGKYSIAILIKVVCDLFGRNIDYSVNQPSFEFNLSRAVRHNAIPKRSFYESLVKFANQI